VDVNKTALVLFQVFYSLLTEFSSFLTKFSAEVEEHFSAYDKVVSDLENFELRLSDRSVIAVEVYDN
jgi:hypothetical protein